MRFGFLVNDVAEMYPAMTTALLIDRAARAGHEVFVVPIDALQVDARQSIIGYARSVTAQDDVAATLEALVQCRPETVDLATVDALLVRTNPARDERAWAHDMALECAMLLEERGVFVANRPGALRRSMSKMSLTRLPTDVLPTTLVTRTEGALEQFMREAPGHVVVKPLAGTRGQDVFRIAPGRELNLPQICAVLTRDGYCVAQHFVPEAVEGDVRLVLLDGQPLQMGGQTVAIKRVPSDKDFRSNIAVGGRAEPTEVTDAMRAIVDAIGANLAAQGLWLVGLDIIGTKVVEVNVFSTGGLHHAELFYGVPFVDAILDWVVQRAQR